MRGINVVGCFYVPHVILNIILWSALRGPFPDAVICVFVDFNVAFIEWNVMTNDGYTYTLSTRAHKESFTSILDMISFLG